MRVVLPFRFATFVKFLVAVFLFVALLLGGAWLYFQVKFTQLVDKALENPPWKTVPAVYSAPGLFFPGQRLSRDECALLLQKHGYAQGDLDRPPAFRLEPGGTSLLLNSGADAAALGVTGPVQARLRFGPDSILSISSPDERARIARLLVRPASLSGGKLTKPGTAPPFAGIPQHLVNAILAAEDRRFFSHPGVDFWGVLRSLVRNIQEERIAEGGSTLTQQLVKNHFLSPERTFARKFQEAFMSMILESRLSKRELFAIYVGYTYLGNVASRSIYGFAQAADAYCGKDIHALSLAESALLAGMIRSPNRTSPFTHPEAALKRRLQVLQAMVKAGFVSAAEAQTATAEPLPTPGKGFLGGLNAPYYMDCLSEHVALKPVPEKATPPPVLTTLNLELQRCVETGIAEGLRAMAEANKDSLGVRDLAQVQAAAVVLDATTGDVLALSGGRDYALSQYNRAVSARRQAGSVIKPFLYAICLDAGQAEPSLDLTPSSTVVDAPVTVSYGRRSYTPHNYKDSYLGAVNMATALSHSLNAATLLFAQRAGFGRLAGGINRLGFTARAEPYPSLALGALDATPLEMAAAYTAFYRGGASVPPRFVKNAPGESPKANPAAFSAESARAVLGMLRLTVEEGTAKQLRALGFTLPLAAKTGTAKDGWFMGLTGNLVVCCWVGFDDNREFPLSGGRSALYVFASFLKAAQGLYPVEGLDVPAFSSAAPPESTVSGEAAPAPPED